MTEGIPAREGSNYSLEGAVETERLQVQARTWEPEAEALFDLVGVRRGASCIDLGCGAMGVLGPLSRRVGAGGRVVGLDMDRRLLDVAGAHVKAEGLPNVELLPGDAYATGLPAASFDLVHARCVVGPVGRPDELLAEMLRLVKPGGVVVMQEPDPNSLHLFPRCVAFEALRELLETYLVMTGGDPRAGQKIFQLLRRAGLRDVQVRGALKVLKDGHPYMRMPLLGIMPLRAGIVDALLSTDRELDQIAEVVEERLREPHTHMTTFTLMQAWGTR